MSVLFWIILPIFVVSAGVSIWFQAGGESKDERGRSILSASFAVAFPIALLGFCAINVYERWAGPFTYGQLKMSFWMLLALSYSVHAGAILVLRRRI